MTRWTIAAALAGAGLLAGATQARCEDQEAGVPLTPQEAAGAWTLESAGRSLCGVTLGAASRGQRAYVAKAEAACGPELPGAPAGWRPTTDGMELVDASGQPLIAFARWSNSLFVSHRASGADLQLRRGR